MVMAYIGKSMGFIVQINIETMSKDSRLGWKAVSYSEDNMAVPQERWGQRLLRVSEQEIVMFGGYGGSANTGKYLDDLWTYNLHTNIWNKLVTSGDGPGPRSNYSLHFNEVTKQIIMFGGGTDQKIRFNDVWSLNWQTKIWNQIEPQPNHSLPWERTYHSSEFVYPYLLVFGGESLSCIDLDDLWTFNVETRQWRELKFKVESLPQGRRFHSSTFLNGFFYVIGGCKGANYTLLGDLYRVDLKALFQNQQFEGFEWEHKIRICKQLQRWGHSTNIYQGKIYLSCGRISSCQDSAQTFVIDPERNQIQLLQIPDQNQPKPRRRHSSVVIGNSLLSFGGYNGKYLQTFDYLTLDEFTAKKQKEDCQVLETATIQQLMKSLLALEQMKENVVCLKVYSRGKLCNSIFTSQQSLLQNVYFAKILKYSKDKTTISINLPDLADILAFRLLTIALTKKTLLVSPDMNLSFYNGLFKIMQYYCCTHLFSTLEGYIMTQLTSANCFDFFHLAHQFELSQLRRQAAKLYLVQLSKGEQKSFDTQLESSQNLKLEIEMNQKLSLNLQANDYLKQVQRQIHFDLLQIQLRRRRDTIFRKAAITIKNIWQNRPCMKKQDSTLMSQDGTENNQRGCFGRLVNMVSKWCKKPKIGVQELSNQ